MTTLLTSPRFQLNLFCRKAKFLLLSEELNSYPLNIRVKPLVDFLNVNFAMLKQKLFDNLFFKLTKLLWLSFYEVGAVFLRRQLDKFLAGLSTLTFILFIFRALLSCCPNLMPSL